MINVMKHPMEVVLIAAAAVAMVWFALLPTVAHGATPYSITNYAVSVAPSAPIDEPVIASTTQAAQVSEFVPEAKPIVAVKVRALTDAQIAALLNLLRAFGADEKTVNAVSIALY